MPVENIEIENSVKARVFGRVGSIEYYMDLTGEGGSPGDGWVLMNAERPDELHIAARTGYWILTWQSGEWLKKAITAYRWKVETGGLALGGVRVATGLEDQNRITTVVANARLAGLDSVKFKAESGWVTLSVAELEGIAAAVARHVQACFAAECEHHLAIDAIEQISDPAQRLAALESYDVYQGWPEN